MKILLVLVLALLVVGCEASYSSTGQPLVQSTEWFDSGVVAAPTAGQVLVDVGPEDDGDTFTGCLAFWATLSATFELQHRNAANSSTLHLQRYSVGANETLQVCGFPVTIADDERLRVTNVNLLTLGSVSVSIYHQ